MINPKHPIDAVIIDVFRRDDVERSYNITELHEEVAKAGLKASRPTIAARVKSLRNERALSFGGYSKFGHTQAADYWLVDEHPYFGGDGFDAVDSEAVMTDRDQSAPTKVKTRMLQTLADIEADFERQVDDQRREFASIRATLEAE